MVTEELVSCTRCGQRFSTLVNVLEGTYDRQNDLRQYNSYLCLSCLRECLRDDELTSNDEEGSDEES